MDKGFVYVLPIKSKSKVLQYLKEHANDIGSPDAILCDAAS